jgi:serine protease Do
MKAISMRAILLTTAMIVLAVPALAQEAGWIGITIEDQTDRGAIIRRVERNSPAERAGLKEGDVIVEFNRQEVIGVQQLTRLVRETPTGRTVDVKVRRDNRDETLKVTAERASDFGGGRFELNVPGSVHILADRFSRDFPRIEMNTVHVQSGVRVEDLTDQMRDFFGVFSNNGVLVTSVESGSPLAKAGLKAGDVVTAIDGRTIRGASDFSREMRASSRPTLKIFRDKQERELKVE